MVHPAADQTAASRTGNPWISDGTRSGTFPLANVTPGSTVVGGVAFNPADIVGVVGSVIIFTVEYALRVWSCTQDPSGGKYAHPVFGRLRFVRGAGRATG